MSEYMARIIRNQVPYSVLVSSSVVEYFNRIKQIKSYVCMLLQWNKETMSEREEYIGRWTVYKFCDRTHLREEDNMICE
jgi:hypothetical protein